MKGKMGKFSKGGGFSLKIIGDNLDSLDNFDIVKTGESFGESYDKEISNYQGGFDEGRMAGYEDGKIAGFEDGKIAGFEDGKYKQSLDIAKSMKQDNIDIEKIALYTGLDIKEIEKL